MWLPRTAIRRRQETLPPVRHPTAYEPLMFHSARDEKGKAQESIGSWAFLQHKGLLLLVSHPVPASCLHWVEVQPKGFAGKEPACECSLFDGILIQ